MTGSRGHLGVRESSTSAVDAEQKPGTGIGLSTDAVGGGRDQDPSLGPASERVGRCSVTRNPTWSLLKSSLFSSVVVILVKLLSQVSLANLS